MNKLITSFLLLLSLGCAKESRQSIKVDLIAKNDTSNLFVGPLNIDEPYDIKFQIEKTKNNDYNLVVSINLHNGAHFISPHAKRDFKGKFFMDLRSYEHLSFKGNIFENPRSVEELDPHPFVNGSVNWVRVNTTYKQPLNLLSKDDFEVFGRVLFTIEPRCSLEVIPFAISYKDGVMKFFEPKC